MKNSLEFTQAQFDDFKNTNGSFTKKTKQKMSEFSSKIQRFSDAMNEATAKINDLDNKADDLENRSRRNNLRFDGIPENMNETWQDTEDKLKEILSSKLELEMN